MLLGYPHVVDAAVDVTGVCNAVSTDVRDWFSEMGDRLVGVMSAAAAATGADFVDVRAAFNGHEACTTSADEWINAVIAYSSSGSGTNFRGSGSFHPKGRGQEEYASVLFPALN